MAAKTQKEIPLNQLKHIDDFKPSDLQTARTTIRLHLDHEEFLNTITQHEIAQYATILNLKKSVICEIIAEEEGEIVTVEQRANIERRELVEA